MFWILYFLFIPIAMLCCWIECTLSYNGVINWKNITIGQFLGCISVSLWPAVNIIVSIICLIDLLSSTGWLNKPLFRK